MRKNTAQIKQLVIASMLIALSIVLTRVLAINISPTIRYSFGKIPIFMAGLILGPVWGVVVGGLSDVIGYLLRPTGPYFIGFTLSACLSGCIPPLVFRLFKNIRFNYSLKHFALAIGISDIITRLLLHSIWVYLYLLYFLHKESATLSFLSNVPQFVIMVVLNTLSVYLLYKPLSRVYHR